MKKDETVMSGKKRKILAGIGALMICATVVPVTIKERRALQRICR